MIVVSNLSFRYQQPIFEQFNWQVEPGETWAVLGPSGCGKSTLLALLAGLKVPQSGEIRIHGERILRPRPQTGLILQDYGLLPWATVRENIALGLRIRSFYGADGVHAPKKSLSLKRVDFWLERLGLASVAAQYPAQLSGGQRQRTAIARTLVLEPDVLLMDEPFSSLDAPTREGLQALTLELTAEHGLTLIIVTHAIEEAALLGRKILLLHQPPNRQAQVIPNPSAGSVRYREQAEYAALCHVLRESLRG
ncbi:MAG: ABC transporter ATP-binding protein [Anaerolineae bacterium]|nr:MAG: ABC transporter ATP-binding protein [Anaerolineae bacterium]